MNAEPRLLVVDDEKVVCDSCTRIFEPQGFKVEVAHEPGKGLELAAAKDYTAVLLDLKMPGMDGLEFLEKLRQKNPKVPVIMITGYSSIQTAAAAMRLGATDYIPKPFTPDEISCAVRRLTPGVQTNTAPWTATTRTTSGLASASTWSPLSDEFQFMDECWVQLGQDGTVRAGTVLTREEASATTGWQLPKVGEAVYRGLPLAAMVAASGAKRIVPAPVSGEVIEVHEGTNAKTWEDPCHEGWLVRIRPAALSEDLKRAKMRNLVLLGTNENTAKEQRNQLSYLGCKVHLARDVGGAIQMLRDSGAGVVVLDGASLGNEGPELVKRLNTLVPGVKVVVAAGSGDKHEAAYRANKILYYAMEPFGDNEILDILEAAFRPAPPVVAPLRPATGIPRWVRQIRMTNRNGHNVSLLASGGVLLENDGLGQKIVKSILDGAFPLRVTLGKDALTTAEIQHEAGDTDRVLLLLVSQDAGRIPGSVLRNAPHELVSGAGEAAAKAVVLMVQPEPRAGALAFDQRTTSALAEMIVKEMTSN